MSELEEPAQPLQWCECFLVRAALKECSDDLAEWITNHYNLLHYPQEKLRYDREMEPVLRARALLKP